jgi:hypothetical protein
MPVDDRLVRHAILVVQDLEHLLERLHESCIGITVDLGRVDESYFGLCTVTECLKDRCSCLLVSMV